MFFLSVNAKLSGPFSQAEADRLYEGLSRSMELDVQILHKRDDGFHHVKSNWEDRECAAKPTYRHYGPTGN